MFALLLTSMLAAQPAAPSAPTPTPAAATPRVNSACVPEPRSDKWWQDRNNSFNARAKEGAKNGDIDIIFLGDSITQGWEGEGKAVWQKHFGSRHAVNFGISGDRTQHVLYRVSTGNLDGLDSPDKGKSPRLVVLMIGTNNTAGSADVANTAEEINQGVRADVRTIHDKLPSAHILVLGIFPRSEKPDAARALVAQTNKLLANIGEGGEGERAMGRVHFFDISDRFLEKDGTISKEIMPDFLHLSPKGYQIWADAILPRVNELAPA